MNVVVTGGAGFIGSHLVDALVARGDRVRVLDDLSNGRVENVNDAAELVEGNVADAEVVASVIADAEIVFHQAALGSVRRSIESPLPTDQANIHGTLTVLQSAREAGVHRVIAASSSSVYGGASPLPSREDHPVAPRSPYAVSKVTAEMYCRVFCDLLGIETVCLRYFNVYGPRQRFDSPYAAVVPLFTDALRRGERPTVFGDGKQKRDFTYVDDTVRANLLAAAAPAEQCAGRVYNVGGGQPHSVLDLLATLAGLLDVDPDPVYADPRPGDVRDSQADLTAVGADLGYTPTVSFEDGLRRVVEAGNPPDQVAGGRNTT